MCAEDPRAGRGAQHTILDVPAVLERPGFRRQVLKKTSDPVIRQWFDSYFEPLEPAWLTARRPGRGRWSGRERFGCGR